MSTRSKRKVSVGASVGKAKKPRKHEAESDAAEQPVETKPKTRARAKAKSRAALATRKKSTKTKRATVADQGTQEDEANETKTDKHAAEETGAEGGAANKKKKAKAKTKAKTKAKAKAKAKKKGRQNKDSEKDEKTNEQETHGEERKDGDGEQDDVLHEAEKCCAAADWQVVQNRFPSNHTELNAQGAAEKYGAAYAAMKISEDDDEENDARPMWTLMSHANALFMAGLFEDAIAIMQVLAGTFRSIVGNPLFHLRMGQCIWSLSPTSKKNLGKIKDELSRALLGAGPEMFAGEDSKYLELVQKALRPPEGHDSWESVDGFVGFTRRHLHACMSLNDTTGDALNTCTSAYLKHLFTTKLGAAPPYADGDDEDEE